MKSPYQHRLWMWLALPILALAAGCIVLPVNYYARDSRRNIENKKADQLRMEARTREEVFLLLGEPDYSSADETLLGYAWEKVKVIWAIAGQGGGIGGEIQKAYLMQFSFDASNQLVAVTLTNRWGSELLPGWAASSE